MSTSDHLDFSSLCTNCGMCCNGILFDWAPLDAGEIENARRLGFLVGSYGEETGFSQPCPQLSGTRCSVYGERPGKCRDYECATLRALRKGQIDRDEAQRRVTSALATAERARLELLPGEDFPQARRRRRTALAKPDGHRAGPRFMLLLGALDLPLDRFFRHKDQRHLNFDTAPPDQ